MTVAPTINKFSAYDPQGRLKFRYRGIPEPKICQIIKDGDGIPTLFADDPLADIVARCCAKEARNRFAHAGLVREAVEGIRIDD